MTLILATAYLLGSIPFGLLLTKAAGLGDVRAIGSGNIGATNVLRTGNKKLAAATLLADAFKGAAAVLLARHFAPQAASLALVFAVLGHVFSCWLKFKGGKGVATYIGALTAFSPMAGLVTIVLWLAIFFASRISALAALTSIGLSPLTVYFTGGTMQDIACVAAIAALIFYTHRTNIRRMISGEELRFGKPRD